jgi:hypothetical protein
MGHDQVVRAVPAGTVHNEESGGAAGHLAAEFVEEGLHGVGRNLRPDQADPRLVLQPDLDTLDFGLRAGCLGDRIAKFS